MRGVPDTYTHTQTNKRLYAQEKAMRGVPDCFRGIVWQKLSGSDLIRTKNQGRYVCVCMCVLNGCVYVCICITLVWEEKRGTDVCRWDIRMLVCTCVYMRVCVYIYIYIYIYIYTHILIDMPSYCEPHTAIMHA